MILSCAGVNPVMVWMWDRGGHPVQQRVGVGGHPGRTGWRKSCAALSPTRPDCDCHRFGATVFLIGARCAEVETIVAHAWHHQQFMQSGSFRLHAFMPAPFTPTNPLACLHVALQMRAHDAFALFGWRTQIPEGCYKCALRVSKVHAKLIAIRMRPTQL